MKTNIIYGKTDYYRRFEEISECLHNFLLSHGEEVFFSSDLGFKSGNMTKRKEERGYITDKGSFIKTETIKDPQKEGVYCCDFKIKMIDPLDNSDNLCADILSISPRLQHTNEDFDKEENILIREPINELRRHDSLVYFISDCGGRYDVLIEKGLHSYAHSPSEFDELKIRLALNDDDMISKGQIIIDYNKDRHLIPFSEMFGQISSEELYFLDVIVPRISSELGIKFENFRWRNI